MSAGNSEPPAGRDRFASYRDTLEAYGFHPSRRLGQNFLLDPSLHRFIADVASPGPEDLILEIGPGLGFLTRELADRSRVVAVEIDDRLVRVLRDEIPTFPGADRVRLVHSDALSRGRLHPDVVAVVQEECEALPAGGRFLVVANLPYAIAGPLVMELGFLDRPPDELVLLIQLEMARRLSAQAGTREYGALSVFLQLCYQVEFLRKVGSQVFRPRPRVDSGIVHLRRHPDGNLEESPEDRRSLAEFLRGLFASRRKKLRNAPVWGEGCGEASVLGDLLDQRPDALDPQALLRIWTTTIGRS